MWLQTLLSISSYLFHFILPLPETVLLQTVSERKVRTLCKSVCIMCEAPFILLSVSFHKLPVKSITVCCEVAQFYLPTFTRFLLSCLCVFILLCPPLLLSLLTPFLLGWNGLCAVAMVVNHGDRGSSMVSHWNHVQICCPNSHVFQCKVTESSFTGANYLSVSSHPFSYLWSC